MAARKENVAREEIEDLMAEGFGGPLPARQHGEGEVTVAVLRENPGRGSSRCPFSTSYECLSYYFSFWQSRITQDQATSFARSYSIGPSIYRFFCSSRGR